MQETMQKLIKECASNPCGYGKQRKLTPGTQVKERILSIDTNGQSFQMTRDYMRRIVHQGLQNTSATKHLLFCLGESPL
jgi:hypothetical protein